MGKKSKRNRSTKGSKVKVVDQRENITLSNAWKIGEKAFVCGLKQETRFNGKVGTIISEPKGSSTRYGVSVDGHQIAVLPSNLGTSTKFVNEYQYDAVDQMREGNSVDIVSMAKKRMVRDMMTEEQQIEKYGRKIKPLPNFLEELLKGGGFPKGVDPYWANRHLRTAFEIGSKAPHTYEVNFASPDYEHGDFEWWKRIATNDPAKEDWFRDARRQVGDIFPQMGLHYPSNVRHSYSNQTYKRECLLLGTTHVAVGFVDLGILIEANLVDRPEPGMDGPLIFLGVDSSPYVIAKTIVVWKMIYQSEEKEHLRYAMQVWFSATLEAEAEKYMKKILLEHRDYDKGDPRVNALLRHWRDAETMTLKKARAHWASRRLCGFSFVAHLEREKDRIDMAKYELTGDFGFGDDRKPACGNVIMLDCPKGTPRLFENETVFSALNLEAIAPSLSADTTLFEASQEYIMKGLSRIASWERQGILTVQLVCEDIQNITDFIAACNPWTITWSNVLDYMDYADFHQLARACSTGNTVHSGYSMNWLTNVWGVHILDYEGCEVIHAIIEAANKWVEVFYKSCGWEKYLRLSPPNSPDKTVSFLLEMEHFEKWADHFFGIGQQQGPCQVAGVLHASISPLSQTGSNALHFGWTYNPDIEVTKQSSKY